MSLYLSESRYLRYFSFTILYVAQGFPFGLVTVALPAFLLEQGTSPAAVGGFVGGAMLPWTFKWLAGPMMDRFHYLAMGRRRPWVLLAQLGLVLTGLTIVEAAVPAIEIEGDVLVVRVARLRKPIRVPLLFGMLQTHLGVRFVGGSDRGAPAALGMAEPPRSDVAAQLREALAVGDITAIQALARRLQAGHGADAAMGERINRLATNFDFDGLERLAQGLGA